MMYLLDTDILVGLLRAMPEAEKSMNNLKEYGIATSAITLHELFHGAFKSKNRDKSLNSVTELAYSINTLDFDEDCARLSGKLKAETEKAGKYPGELDLMIAAVALKHSLKLVTRNKKNFENISGLEIKIW